MNRRKMNWSQVRSLKTAAAVMISTALGAGFFPIAPGTMGTLFAVPLVYATAHWSSWVRIFFWGSLFLIGVWSAKVMDETMQSEDNQNIVIDEVVGYGITAWTADNRLWALALAFILFRLFDATKPPPVRQIDRWSKIQAGKSHSSWWGGFGVMADDLLAGLLGLLVMVVLQAFYL